MGGLSYRNAVPEWEISERTGIPVQKCYQRILLIWDSGKGQMENENIVYIIQALLMYCHSIYIYISKPTSSAA